MSAINSLNNYSHLEPGSVPIKNTPFEMSPNKNSVNRFENAVKEVQKGKRPYAFVKYFTEEEKEFLASLSTKTIETVFKIAGIQTLHLSKDQSKNNPEDPSLQQAAQLLNRLISHAGEHQFNASSLAIYYSGPHANWHTDGGSNLKEQEHSLRFTFSIKGPPTQFFVPKEKERDEFIKITDPRLLETTVEKIVDNDPARVMRGDDYDLCIFHSGTIHKGPDIITPGRFLLTINSDLNTPSIGLQIEP